MIYRAHISDVLPWGFSLRLEAMRIDAINRKILASGKAWPGLELPRNILPGHYFTASHNGVSITIHKESI